MPTCSLCGTAFAYRTYWEPPEPCDCGSNEPPHHGKTPRSEDYEPTEDELEKRTVELRGRKP